VSPNLPYRQGAQRGPSLRPFPQKPQRPDRGTSKCSPSHKTGHWVLGLQAAEPSAADAVVQGTLTICKDSTDLTNAPQG
jgi:hypothetical protein